jgi:hypothetical protein
MFNEGQTLGGKKMQIRIIGLSIIFIAMLTTTIWASLQIGLPTALETLWPMAWFKATIIDFYFNQYIIVGIIHYLDRSWLKTLGWLILCTGLGSMASAIYFILYIVKK